MLLTHLSLNPESLHQITILFSDRGVPASYRHMNGYGSHTFSLAGNLWRLLSEDEKNRTAQAIAGALSGVRQDIQMRQLGITCSNDRQNP